MKTEMLLSHEQINKHRVIIKYTENHVQVYFINLTFYNQLFSPKIFEWIYKYSLKYCSIIDHLSLLNILIIISNTAIVFHAYS